MFSLFMPSLNTDYISITHVTTTLNIINACNLNRPCIQTCKLIPGPPLHTRSFISVTYAAYVYNISFHTPLCAAAIINLAASLCVCIYINITQLVCKSVTSTGNLTAGCLYLQTQ